MKKLSIVAFLPIALTVPPVPVYAQAQAVPAAVAACYAAPWACAVVGATAGGYIILNYGQKQFCTWAGCKPLRMMQDADNENTHDIGWSTYAPNKDVAESRCQQEAANRSTGSAVVTCLGCRQSTRGTDGRDPRFGCTLRIEAR